MVEQRERQRGARERGYPVDKEELVSRLTSRSSDGWVHGLIGGARGRTLDWFRDMDENREQIQENSRETIKSEESKEEESHKKNIPKGCWLEGA